MDISDCATDDDLEAWRAVWIAVAPGERCLSVAVMKAQESPRRLLVLARRDGIVVGSGIADESDTAGSAFAMPRVVPEHRRGGVGSALLHVLAEHCSGLGRPLIVSGVDDEGSLAFAQRFGFGEVDREVQQTRTVGAEEPSAPRPDCARSTPGPRPATAP